MFHKCHYCAAETNQSILYCDTCWDNFCIQFKVKLVKIAEEFEQVTGEKSTAIPDQWKNEVYVKRT
jgi:hypothetical protein